ncbi:uncharacterized protein LOC143301795 [Babylonia areolata]|uniref:uncharacterized protein LOC143301795 n=1 Tax=Babylonia areolata TaxID=304850 RepID=UPI003FD501E8
MNRKWLLELTPFLVYLAVLMVCGLVGNPLVFFVYYWRFKGNVTRILIMAISVCDFLTNIVALMTEFFNAVFHFTYHSGRACKVLNTAMTALSVFSCLVLVAVSVERRNILHRGLQTRQRHQGALALSTCCALALILSVPRALLFGSNATQHGGAVCNNLDFYLTTPFPIAYNLVLVTCFALCLVTMCVSYARIARHLWRHNRRREDGAGLARLGGGAEYNDGVTVGAAVLDMENGGHQNPAAVQLAPASGRKSSPPPEPSLNNGVWGVQVDHLASKRRQRLQQQTREMGDVLGVPTPLVFTTRFRETGNPVPSRTTFMLFVVTVVFILNYVPFLVSEALLYSHPENPVWKDVNIRYFLLRSYYLNSAVNPVVYCFCCARFRFECRRLFCKS